MTETKTTISFSDGKQVSAVLTGPESASSGWLFMYAPGAGSGLDDPFGVHASESLANQGISTLRFQFPYAEAGKRRPDSNRILEATWIRAIDEVRDSGVKLVIGGRSMGGRIASQVVAKGTDVDALALFAYPLRPPWNPDQLRDGHLGDVDVPTLFCSGTRDTFGSPEELLEASKKVPHSKLHLLDGADHGFKTLKASRRSQVDVWDEAVDAFVAWLGSL